MDNSGKIYYGTGIDNTQLQRDAEKSKHLIRGIGDKAEAEGTRIDNSMKKVGATIAAVFTVQQAKNFISHVAQIRGEFQQLEIAFTTMLKSKVESDKLMAEIVDFAAKTPFDLKGVATGAKQLMAYGFEVDSIRDNLTMLGNIASGVGSQLGDVIYLYGTLNAQGRVMTKDLMQFAGRGIPIYKELAKVMETNEKGVLEFAAAGKIAFSDVEKAFQNMVSESGLYYNLMQEQSKSITGQLANLGDAVDVMFNEIGQSTQGVISSAISGASNLVENYQKVGKTIASLVAVYGSYKAALITFNAVQKASVALSKGWTAAELVRINAMVVAEKVTKALNKTSLANPYVLVATALLSLGAALLIFKDRTTAAELATKNLNKRLEEQKTLDDERKSKVDALIDSATNQALADLERVSALQELKKQYSNIFADYDIERLKLADILELKKQIAEEDAKRKTKENEQQLLDYDVQIAEARKKYNDYESRAGSPGYSGSYAKLLKSQIDVLIEEQKQFTDKVITPDKANQFIASITGISNEQLEKEIELRQSLIQEIGKTDDTKNIPGLGTFSKKQLNEQLAALALEQNKRNEILTTGAQDLKQANKELQALIDERNKILTTPMSLADRRSKLEDVDGRIEAVGKLIKQLGVEAPEKDLEQITKDELDLIRKNEELAFKARQSSINAMNSGAEKELAQLKLNYDIKRAEIERQEQDLLSQMTESARRVWEAKGGKGSFDSSKVSLSDTQVDAFSSIKKDADNEYLLSIDAVYEKLKDKYLNYAEQRKAIEESFQEEIAALTKKYGADSTYVKTAKERLEKALKAVSEDALTEKGLLELYLFGDGSEYIQQKIKEVYPLFEDITKLSVTELHKVGEAIQNIELTPEQLEAFRQAGVDVEKLKENLEKAKDASDEAIDVQKWEKVLQSAQALSSSFARLGESLEAMGGGLGELGKLVSGIASEMDSLVVSFDKESTTTDKIAAGVSSIANLFNYINERIQKNKQAQEEWNEKILQAAHNAALARVELEAYQQANLFGVENPYAKALAGAEQYAAAMAELRAESDKISSGKVQTGTKDVYNQNNSTGFLAGMGTGAAIGSIIASGIGTFVGAVIGSIIGAVVGSAVKDTIPVFESLGEKYGEIFNEETFEINPAILADYDSLDEKTKQLVDNWEEIREKALEAQEQMRQNFQDLAGEIGTQLSDALVGAFREGDIYKAMDTFKDSAISVIEEILSQLIFAQYFKELFTNLENDMMDSFGPGGDNNIVDDIVRFLGVYKDSIDGYNEAMIAAQEELGKEGLDIFKQARTGASKGIATASQESVDENNGRLTAIQGHTYGILEELKAFRSESTQSLRYLAGIENNTAKLVVMEKTLSSLKTTVDDINTKGLTIKV